MKNILYLDDYINLYSNKLNKIIVEKPYKDTLHNGKIINSKKFIKIILKIKEKHKIQNSILSEEIIVIINSTIKEDDKLKIINLLEELNYKKIVVIREIELIKLNKKQIFINYNDSYFYIYYINEYGKIAIDMYNNNYVNKRLVLEIIKVINKKEIIITGKKYKELVNILKKTTYNYYYYEDCNNLFIEMYNIMSNIKKIK